MIASVGLGVGVDESSDVTVSVGLRDGWYVGSNWVGKLVGRLVGFDKGAGVTASVGLGVGFDEGSDVADSVGLRDGWYVGSNVVGKLVGRLVGFDEGAGVTGWFVGCEVGFLVGSLVG